MEKAVTDGLGYTEESDVSDNAKQHIRESNPVIELDDNVCVRDRHRHAKMSSRLDKMAAAIFLRK